MGGLQWVENSEIVHSHAISISKRTSPYPCKNLSTDHALHVKQVIPMTNIWKLKKRWLGILTDWRIRLLIGYHKRTETLCENSPAQIPPPQQHPLSPFKRRAAGFHLMPHLRHFILHLRDQQRIELVKKIDNTDNNDKERKKSENRPFFNNDCS